jgi:hypothetical protein
MVCDSELIRITFQTGSSGGAISARDACDVRVKETRDTGAGPV